MKPALIVVPLSGKLPFLIEGDSWNAVLRAAEVYDKDEEDEYYIIDPCSRCVVDTTDANGEVEKFEFYEIRTKEEIEKMEAEQAAESKAIDAGG